MQESSAIKGAVLYSVVIQLFDLHTGSRKMTDKEWDEITEVHLKGAFACTKAAWPHFRKQKFGRVLNTASAAGLYGIQWCSNVLHVAVWAHLCTELLQIKSDHGS
jgi:NAD(P)-dependent dehydrogenase (short-subunit alcohol dehydrogenase family)